MKSFRLVLGVLSGGLVAAGIMSGCSGDDTVVSSKDASADGSGIDGSNPVDGSSFDGGSPADGGSADGGVDGNAPFVTPEQFIDEVAQTLCTRTDACCKQIDAGAIVNQKCLDKVRGFGWQGSSSDIAALIADQDAGPDSGQAIQNVTFDLNGIQECLNRVKLIPCAVGSTLDLEALQACYIDAVHGKATTGQACKYAAECAQPAYCQFADGGVTGTCQPLVATGGDCSQVRGTSYDQANRGNEACSRRATGTGQATPQFCDNIAADGITIKSFDQWTCTAAKGIGSACGFNAVCKSQICTGGICSDPLLLANPAVCSTFQ
jgi:hypothetical protein